MEKKNYGDMKNEIKDFKKKLFMYFKEPNNDVTLSQLFRDLELNLDQLDFLQYCLDEMVLGGVIKRTSSLDHYEYDLEGDLN
jgi:hypothetical protein